MILLTSSTDFELRTPVLLYGTVSNRSLPNSELKIGGSFNGRTTDSDSVNRGSTPRPPAIEQRSLQNIPIACPEIVDAFTAFLICRNLPDNY